MRNCVESMSISLLWLQLWNILSCGKFKKLSFDFCQTFFVVKKKNGKHVSHLFWTTRFWFQELHSNNPMWSFIPYKLCPRLVGHRQQNMPAMSKQYFQRQTSSNLPTTNWIWCSKKPTWNPFIQFNCLWQRSWFCFPKFTVKLCKNWPRNYNK